MKNLYAFAWISLAGLIGSSGSANAWYFLGKCSCKEKCIIYSTQYNAFSAFCPTGIKCKGCCPFMGCGCGLGCGWGGMGCGMGPGCCGPVGGGPVCDAGCDASGLGQLPGVEGLPPGAEAPAGDPPTYHGPMPTPAERTGPLSYYPPTPIAPAMMANPMVQAAGYYPGYNAGYQGYPMNYGYQGYPMMGNPYQAMMANPYQSYYHPPMQGYGSQDGNGFTENAFSGSR
ncbi:MAG: hypothetical protein JO112_09705 [Planctomycetes bacterium]|nr:hypothetical protein [Planctomycetota bacterium]